MQSTRISRRRFLETTAIAATATMLPFGHAFGQAKPKYTRFNVMSAGGKKALASYARAIGKMLALPPDHPQNWFRNAFIHSWIALTAIGGSTSGIVAISVTSKKRFET
jgi:tyrosinase